MANLASGDSGASCLTSDEVNFLIYRYLLESGFVHSAYVFGNESFVARSQLEGTDQLPAGALITYIQKGMQYVEIESHINDDGTENICDENFSILKPHSCVVKEKRQIFEPYEPAVADYGVLEIEEDEYSVLQGHQAMVIVCAWNPVKPVFISGSGDGTIRVWDVTSRKRDRGKDANLIMQSCVVVSLAQAESEPQDSEKNTQIDIEVVEDGNGEVVEVKKEKDDADKESKGGEASVGGTANEEGDEKQASKKRKLGADQEQKQDADHKKAKLSDDAKPSCGDQKDSSSTASTADGALRGPKNRSVLALDWNMDGTLFAGGAYDSPAGIWSEDGRLLKKLEFHKAPVSCVRWSKHGGGNLLTASMDHSVAVWSKEGSLIKSFSAHSGPVLDVDWKDDKVFASCSSDKSINVYDLSSSSEGPVHTAIGHEGDVNMVKWDSTGSYLASCSDDCSVKIWKTLREAEKTEDGDVKMGGGDEDSNSNNNSSSSSNSNSSSSSSSSSGGGSGPIQMELLLDLREHKREVCSMSWWSDKTDKKQYSEEPSKHGQEAYLASGSMDTTVKVWDVKNKGRCILTLCKHVHPVTSLVFSPNGTLLASASHDRVHIWEIPNGELVRTFKCGSNGGVHDLSWNKNSNQLCVASSDKQMFVMDVKPL